MNEQFIEKIKKKFGSDILNEYNIIGEYDGCGKKIEFVHTNCGTHFMMTPNDFLNGHRCPECAKLKRAKKSTLTIESYKEKIEAIFPGEYEILSTNITKLSDRITVKHKLCGNIYETTARNLTRGMGCRKCSYIKTGKKQKGVPKAPRETKTTEQFKQDVLKAIGLEYEVLGTYKNSYNRIKIRHKTCGNEYEVLPHNIISNKTKCPKCSTKGNRSEKEKDLYDFIKQIYSGEIQHNFVYKNADGPEYELDIYIPALKIGIEFDGLYWHSDCKVPKNYHIDKTNFFYKHGIRVVHIFEDEWDLKKDIVKTKLKNILGVSDAEKIYARKTIVKEITSKEKNEFLEKYHIQGEDKSKFSAGLFYNNKLVAVMTFCKPRKALGGSSGKYDYELSRFATSCNIPGGFSKLLAYLTKEHPEIERIQTFADLRWSSRDSNVYIKNGFTLIEESKPNYWYVPKNIGIREYRYKYRKSELPKLLQNFDPAKTEIENMKNAGYKVIYDCGNLVYYLNLSQKI